MVFFSASYARKVWTQEEASALVYAAVVSNERRVIVVRLDDHPLPPLLAHRLWRVHPAQDKVVRDVLRLSDPTRKVEPIGPEREPIQLGALDPVSMEEVGHQVADGLRRMAGVGQMGGILELDVPGLGRARARLTSQSISNAWLAELDNSLELARIHAAFVRDLRRELAENVLGKFATGYRLELERRVGLLDGARREVGNWVQLIVLRELRRL